MQVKYINTEKTKDNMLNKKFMLLAIKKAEEGIKKGQTPFGACIVKNNKVISCTHNTVWKTTDSTAHAEINAIRTTCKKLKSIDLSGCILYSTCEPCPMCFTASHWAKIDKIIYGASISDAKKAGFSELTISSKKMKQLGKSSTKVTSGFLKEDNKKLFDIWLRNSKKKPY